MRALAKTIHVSVITVQKAYEELTKDGFIETTVGRGSFVAAQNRDFIIEEHLINAVDVAKMNGIELDRLMKLLTIFYEENE